MARAATRDQRDLARLERSTTDEFVILAQHEDIGMRGRETIEAFGQHRIDRIQEFLHVSSRHSLMQRDQPPLLPVMLVIFWMKSLTARSSTAFCLSSPKSGTMTRTLSSAI